jgi:hypothetical protein
MLKGIHTIRSGFSTDFDSNTYGVRRYTMDNGDYERNMRIIGLELISGVDPGQLDMGNSKILFVIATTEQGATPLATVGTNLYQDQFQFRFDDSSQIAWGIVSPEGTGVHTIVDPGHIIPEDIYVNAWTMTTGANPNPLLCPLSYLITMASVENTGSEALLYQIKQNE